MVFQFPFTLATAIGDGCLGIPASRPNSTYLSFTHSGEQRDYLAYKLTRVNRELGTEGRASEPVLRHDERTGNSYLTCQAMVASHSLRGLRELLYPNGRKQITPKVLDLVGLEGLAVMWMDDGCVVRGECVAGSMKNRGLLALYVPKQECIEVCDWIGDLTGALAKPYIDRGSWRVRIEMGQMPGFALAIRPYIHSSMAGKVTLSFKRKTKSRLIYETSLTVPFVDEGDKATRARSTAHVVMI